VFTPEIVPNGGIDESVAPNKIEDHKWTSGDNAEPLPDGVRNRNGSAAENATPLWEISLSHEGGTDTREFVDATSEYIAQGFQNDDVAMTVRQVGVRLKINSGSPTGNIECAIYDDDGGDPDVETVDAAADFSDFSTIDSSTLTSEFKWYYFTLATAANLSKLTTYHLVIRHTGAGGTGTNTVDIEEVTTPSGYANGVLNFDDAGETGTWTSVPDADLNFRIYSAGADITAIADYRLSDATTNRHLVFANKELYKNDGGTMTSVSARERVGMTSNVNVFPSWAVGQDRFLLTNNTEISKKFYVLSGTEYWENEGIAAPTAALTLGQGIGNVLTDGTYYVDYYYWNDDIGQPSLRWKDGTTVSGADNEVILTTDHITISGLPTTTVRENDRATHLRFELKEPTSSVFRLVKEVALGTTTTTIESGDLPTTVEAEYNHQIPPVHEIKAVAENRQFIANVVDGSTRRPYRLMFSAINASVPYYESFPTNNFRDFGRGDGDYITALFFVPPTTLVVGMKNSIRAINARGPKTSDIVVISSNFGIAHHNAGRVIGRRLFFFSNSASNLGHYVWEAGQGQPRLLRGIDDTVKGFEDTRFKYASCAAYSPGDERFQWWTLHTASGGTQGSKIAMYDYELESWAIYTKPAGKLVNVLGTVEEDGIDAVFAGGYDGVEYKQDQGSNDAGTAFTGQFTSKVYDYGAPHIDKRHRWIDYTVATKGTGAIAVSTERDYKARATISTTLDHSDKTGTALVWGTGAWGSTIWAGGSDARRSVPLRGRGENFKHTFSSEDPWHIKSLQFGIQGTERE
jgi:hypothetical protein